ncbi:7-carboxy-7-deazaguanine synthase QueE, partial [Bacillus toyonensis]
MSKIPVLEIFGPTIQGEGMVIGQKTMLIRTAGCDYSCSW